MGFGDLANPRTKVEDLPGDLVAVVKPDGETKQGRERFVWQFDGYGIVSVSCYLPKGERLPKGGVILTPESFDKDRGNDKERRGRTTAAYHDASVGAKGQALDIYVEAPSDFEQFQSVTVKHA